MLMSEQNCVFCSEILDRRDGEIVYENEHTIAFLDYAPVETGHLLVIPKTHFENIFEIEPEIYGEVHKTVKYLAPALLRALSADALNVGQNNGQCANQIVMHYHVHMIPRFCTEESGRSSSRGRFARKPLNWERNISDKTELREIAESIRLEIEKL